MGSSRVSEITIDNPINVICVKWGDRYTAADVNRLKAAISLWLHVPFKFYCYTDDATGCDCDIINMPDDGLEYWWPKLRMFEDQFGLKGRCLFFDLDILIKAPIANHLIENEGFHLICSVWRDGQTSGTDMAANSSCMIWEENECQHIWEHFWKDPEYYMMKYQGIDRFMYHEGLLHKYFKEGIFYSLRYGVKKWDQPKTQAPWYDADYPIALLNGFHKYGKDKIREWNLYDL